MFIFLVIVLANIFVFSLFQFDWVVVFFVVFLVAVKDFMVAPPPELLYILLYITHCDLRALLSWLIV